MRFFPIVLLGTLCAVGAPAQTPDYSNPARPALASGADTNDARAYGALGRTTKKADEAYAAFFWARRLKPARVDYIDGMIRALRVSRYRRRSTKRGKDADPEVTRLSARIDSLQRVIAYRDPFFGLRPLDGTCNARPMADMKTEEVVGRGIYALQSGCYYGTIAYIEEAARRDTMLEHLLHFRAVAWRMVGRPAEAAADMQRSIVGVRRVQAQSIELSMFSTAMLEYMLGMMYTGFGDAVSARAAFERALGEDLSFYMAHVRLAELAMNRADATSAIESLLMATEIRPDDALALAAFARALAAAERYDEARTAYARAIDQAPDYADLRFALAELLERAGEPHSATEAYRDYIDRAPRQDSMQVQFASERISIIQSAALP